jgi:hypothetical protein
LPAFTAVTVKVGESAGKGFGRVENFFIRGWPSPGYFDQAKPKSLYAVPCSTDQKHRPFYRKKAKNALSIRQNSDTLKLMYAQVPA